MHTLLKLILILEQNLKNVQKYLWEFVCYRVLKTSSADQRELKQHLNE